MIQDIVIAICRCALIASPDNPALRHQIARLHNQLHCIGNTVAADMVHKLLHHTKAENEQPLVHSTPGEKP